MTIKVVSLSSGPVNETGLTTAPCQSDALMAGKILVKVLFLSSLEIYLAQDD